MGKSDTGFFEYISGAHNARATAAAAIGPRPSIFLKVTIAILSF
jgi:hypothetical protein